METIDIPSFYTKELQDFITCLLNEYKNIEEENKNNKYDNFSYYEGLKLCNYEFNSICFSKMFIKYLLNWLNIKLNDFDYLFRKYVDLEHSEYDYSGYEFGEFSEDKYNDTLYNFSKIITFYVYKKFIIDKSNFEEEAILMFYKTKDILCEKIKSIKVENLNTLKFNEKDTLELLSFLINYKRSNSKIIINEIDLEEYQKHSFGNNNIFNDLLILYSYIYDFTEIFLKEHYEGLQYLFDDIEGININLNWEEVKGNNEKNTLKSDLNKDTEKPMKQETSNAFNIKNNLENKIENEKKDDDDEICQKCDKLIRKCICIPISNKNKCNKCNQLDCVCNMYGNCEICDKRISIYDFCNFNEKKGCQVCFLQYKKDEEKIKSTQRENVNISDLENTSKLNENKNNNEVNNEKKKRKSKKESNQLDEVNKVVNKIKKHYKKLYNDKDIYNQMINENRQTIKTLSVIYQKYIKKEINEDFIDNIYKLYDTSKSRFIKNIEIFDKIYNKEKQLYNSDYLFLRFTFNNITKESIDLLIDTLKTKLF